MQRKQAPQDEVWIGMHDGTQADAATIMLMPILPPSPATRPVRDARVHGMPGLRWPALLLVSLLLHALLLAVAGGGLSPTLSERKASVMSVALQGVPAAPAADLPADPAAVPASPVAPAVHPRRRNRPKRPMPLPAAVSSETPADPASVNVTDPAPVNATDPAPVSAPDPAAGIAESSKASDPQVAIGTDMPAVVPAALEPTTASTAPPQAATAPPGHHYRVAPPPSVTIDYEVRYVTRGSTTRGGSVISWRNDAGNYSIRGEVTKFGIALSSFRSEGAIDVDGIAPVLYAEKNARRSETNTHFSRDQRKAISFSASTDTFPLAAGAQDRGSILWQLSSIARGDPAQLAPGGVLDVFVAGVRDAEHWLIDVVGEESIALEHGQMQAWHLVRAPRAGTYDKRIDIWLAPAQQWYPVKLRYTETSGDTLDLSLNELH